MNLDIMIDVDDVIFPTIDSIHELAREAGLHDGTVEPVWSGWEAYGCEPEVYWDLWSQFALADGYVKTPPIPGAVEAVRRLYWAGHRIHLVTARGALEHGDNIKSWTSEWLEAFAVPYHTLVFAQNKVLGMWEALDSEWRLFHYAIDDRAKNVEALRDVGVDAYLLTHAHNRSDETAAPRVESVEQFANIILEETP